LEASEYRKIPVANSAASDRWVPKFFERHCPSKKTLYRYEGAWKWIMLWLQRKRIHSPRQTTYRLGIEYLDWRTTFKKRTGKIVRRNTAILELKLLSLVMGEAVRMGYADANPLVSMKIRRERTAKKPELTDEEIIYVGVSFSAFASMATVLHQNQKDTSLFLLLACHLCKPAATCWCSAGSNNAAGQPCFTTRPSNLSKGKGG
jgi:hypothetical protein